MRSDFLARMMAQLEDHDRQIEAKKIGCERGLYEWYSLNHPFAWCDHLQDEEGLIEGKSLDIWMRQHEKEFSIRCDTRSCCCVVLVVGMVTLAERVWWFEKMGAWANGVGCMAGFQRAPKQQLVAQPSSPATNSEGRSDARRSDARYDRQLHRIQFMFDAHGLPLCAAKHAQKREFWGESHGVLPSLVRRKNLSYAVLQATLKTTQKRGFSTTHLCAKLALKRDLF